MFKIEYVETDQYRSEIEQQIVSTLCKPKPLGSGLFADVYQASLDKNLVIKIINDSTDPYWFFVRMLSTQKTQNPHFPVIYRAIEYSNGLKVVVLEKLRTHVGSRELHEGATEALNSLIGNLTSARFNTNRHERAVLGLLGIKFSRKRMTLNSRVVLGSLLFEQIKGGVELPAPLFEAVSCLASTFHKTKKSLTDRCIASQFGIDLHDENFMWRTKGKQRTIVITDPFAWNNC